MHITPANQIQVNFKANTVYRTREEFIKFFIEKIKESYERRSENSRDMLTKLENNEIRLGNYKKYKEPKVVKVSKGKTAKVAKPIKKETITFDELIQFNKVQEEQIKKIK